MTFASVLTGHDTQTASDIFNEEAGHLRLLLNRELEKAGHSGSLLESDGQIAHIINRLRHAVIQTGYDRQTLVDMLWRLDSAYYVLMGDSADLRSACGLRALLDGGPQRNRHAEIPGRRLRVEPGFKWKASDA